MLRFISTPLGRFAPSGIVPINQQHPSQRCYNLYIFDCIYRIADLQMFKKISSPLSVSNVYGHTQLILVHTCCICLFLRAYILGAPPLPSTQSVSTPPNTHSVSNPPNTHSVFIPHSMSLSVHIVCGVLTSLSTQGLFTSQSVNGTSVRMCIMCHRKTPA